MAELTLVEAVNDALHTELERDANVMVIGEDVGRAGGVFRATAGLRDRFGADRCVDTPLAEAGILGSAIGLCMAGWRPVVEMQYDAFSYPSLNQLITHVGRYRWRSGGRMEFPITIRMPYGGGVRAPELHDDSPETYYVHTPGVKVAIPSTPADAKGLLAAAIRDDDPVVVCEHKALLADKGEVPEGEHVVPLGEAAVVRDGADVTIVALAAMVPRAVAAAERLDADHGIDAEVIDLRSLIPLDTAAILRSVAKTSRLFTVEENPRVGGWGAEIVSIVADEAFYSLDAPLVRITTPHIPLPSAAVLEDLAIPSVDRIVATVKRRLDDAR
jgi:pyruvate/2-oxoglutarate/acetoin dehydrogenase E1 component